MVITSDQVTITVNNTNYDVIVTSDGSTQPTENFPITDVKQFRFLKMKMGSNSFSTPENLYIEVNHYESYAPKCNEMVGAMGSHFIMGTQTNPIPEGITEKLIIEDQGDFVHNNQTTLITTLLIWDWVL